MLLLECGLSYIQRVSVGNVPALRDSRDAIQSACDPCEMERIFVGPYVISSWKTEEEMGG
jgi:hypothetical protein